MIAEYLSKQMIKWKVPFLIKLIIKIMTLRRNLLSKKLWDFKYYENIEWIKEYNIENDAFDFNKRKNGISLFARLKNAEDFLEKTIESHINICDEIILVDNNSSDKTKEICIKMQEKYPNKIKFYEYTPEVYWVWNNKWKDIWDNSVHSLSYYYNWTLSKTIYKYVAKLDDDMIIFDRELVRKYTENIKLNWLNYLLILPQINLSYINWKISTPISSPNSKILPPIAWLYLDHWIFPVSEKTYFINDKICETLVFPFYTKISPACIFHLKWLKQNKWVHNLKWKIADLVKNNIDNSKYIELDNNLNNKFNKIWIWKYQ